jgi:hypothetical protein
MVPSSAPRPPISHTILCAGCDTLYKNAHEWNAHNTHFKCGPPKPAEGLLAPGFSLQHPIVLRSMPSFMFSKEQVHDTSHPGYNFDPMDWDHSHEKALRAAKKWNTLSEADQRICEARQAGPVYQLRKFKYIQ